MLRKCISPPLHTLPQCECPRTHQDEFGWRTCPRPGGRLLVQRPLCQGRPCTRRDALVRTFHTYSTTQPDLDDAGPREQETQTITDVRGALEAYPGPRATQGLPRPQRPRQRVGCPRGLYNGLRLATLATAGRGSPLTTSPRPAAIEREFLSAPRVHPSCQSPDRPAGRPRLASTHAPRAPCREGLWQGPCRIPPVRPSTRRGNPPRRIRHKAAGPGRVGVFTRGLVPKWATAMSE